MFIVGHFGIPRYNQWMTEFQKKIIELLEGIRNELADANGNLAAYSEKIDLIPIGWKIECDD